MESTVTIKKKAHEAAKKFLLCRGYAILDEDYAVGEDRIGFVVQDEDDAIAFIAFKFGCAVKQGMPEEDPNRCAFERIATNWLSVHEDCVGDITVRGDMLSMLVFGEKRALIRHHINCFSNALE